MKTIARLRQRNNDNKVKFSKNNTKLPPLINYSMRRLSVTEFHMKKMVEGYEGVVVRKKVLSKSALSRVSFLIAELVYA